MSEMEEEAVEMDDKLPKEMLARELNTLEHRLDVRTDVNVSKARTRYLSNGD